MNQIGKALVSIGFFMVIVGLCVIAASKMGIPFGKLPGDITWRNKNVTVFAPFGTMLVVSVLLSIIFNIISRWKH